MSDTTFLTKASDTGYVVAWKSKYDFKAGKYDEKMTYGEAKKRAEELTAENKDMVFWPERKKDSPGEANRFYHPAGH